LTPLTKCTAAMWMLAYDTVIDCMDEFLKVVLEKSSPKAS